MRVSHLTLQNWRNFKIVDADLSNRMFIVGPNASGKSNLLDSLRFLRDISRIGGGFQQAIASRGGIQRVRCLAARNHNHGRVGVSVALGDDETQKIWEYEVQFTASQTGQHRPAVKNETVKHLGKVVLSRPDKDDQDDPERLSQTALEQVNANKDFRELVEFFQSVRYLHLVPQILREPERGGDKQEDPFGGDFLMRIARTSESHRRRRLDSISTALKIAVPQLDKLELVRDDDGTPHLQARYIHWRTAGARQNERDFSDGTIRLIGLLWALGDGSAGKGPLLLEEPELSLHASVVRQLPTIFARVQRRGGPQVILTTHAPEVLSDEGIGLDEVVLLTPGADGTRSHVARDVPEVVELIDTGMNLDEALRPLTEPAGVSDLSLLTA